MSIDLRYVVYAASDQELVAQRRPYVRFQGLGTCLDEAAAHDRSDLRNFRTTEECSGLDQAAPEQGDVSRSPGNPIPGKEGLYDVHTCPWTFLLKRTSLQPTLYYVLYRS